MKKKALAGMVMIVCMAAWGLGFTWPWQAQSQKQDSAKVRDDQAEKSDTSSADEKKTSGIWTSTPESEDRQTDEDATAELSESASESLRAVNELKKLNSAPSVSRIHKISKNPAVRTLPNFQQKTPQVPPYNVDLLKRQIHEVMRINESLKHNYRSHASVIQNIQEQAQIHEKILETMALKSNGVAQKMQPVEKAVQDEKLKIIQEETEKNYQAMKALESQ